MTSGMPFRARQRSYTSFCSACAPLASISGTRRMRRMNSVGGARELVQHVVQPVRDREEQRPADLVDLDAVGQAIALVRLVAR
jgi:hypothetical protein